jgi:cytochrome c oxidase cbb3-type subunit IV
MDYHAIAHFAQTWGMALLLAAFLVSIVYALWPGNQKRFERAARAPLDDNEEEGDGRQ